MSLDPVQPAMATLIISLAIAAAAVADGKPAATQPLSSGWEQIDQRLVFFTVQLSTVEASIEAANKALVAKGHQKTIKEQEAEAARQRNRNMDAQGGGPISWQDFYGKTAEAFFYHPVDRNTLHLNPDPVASRPPQFDYIYRANQESRRSAEADAAKIGDKIDDLLAYRKELESEQSALWCKIVFRGVISQGYSDKPLYRLPLAGPDGDSGRQAVETASAAISYLKSIDALLEATQKNLDNQEQSLAQLHDETASQRSRLLEKLMKTPANASASSDGNSPIGKFCLLAKRAEDSSHNLLDAYRLALERDARDDLVAKRSYRGQIQQSAVDYAQTILTAHQALENAVAEWKVTPLAKSPEPATAPVTNADTVAARLDSAKAAYTSQVTAAHRQLSRAIDQRLNAAADAGDLDKVKLLQSAKVKAATDGTVDPSITDEGVLAAKKAMEEAIAASRATLASAYRSTISDLTKGRKFGEATAVQEEFRAAGLENGLPSDISTGASSDSRDHATAVGDEPVVHEPHFAGDTLTIRLAGPAENVVWGAGGRLQLLHIKKLKKIAVFDVNSLKIAKYIDLPDDDILYAASRDTLIIATRESGDMQIWNLKTLTKERTVKGVGPQLKTMVMGYDSTGPLCVSLLDETVVVDPKTLSNETTIHWEENARGAAHHLSISADGHTLCGYGFAGWAGSRCVVLRGNEVVSRAGGGYIHENDLLLPRDGSCIYDTIGAGKTFSLDYKSEIDFKALPGYAIPTDVPAYFLSYNAPGKHDKSKKKRLVIASMADRRAVVTLNDLPELLGSAMVKPFQRVMYFPNANLLISLAEGGDSLVLRKVDLYKTLADQDIDYLVITSSPSATVGRGRPFSYQMSVKSRRGSVKYALDSGPEGMTVSPAGLVRWLAPSLLKDQSVAVIVRVSDDSKQETFQSFTLSIEP